MYGKIIELFLEKTKKEQEMLIESQRVFTEPYFIETCCGLPGKKFTFLVGNINGKNWYDVPGAKTDSWNETQFLFSMFIANDEVMDGRLRDAVEAGYHTGIFAMCNRIYEQYKDEKYSGITLIEMGSHHAYNTIPLAEYCDHIVCVEPFRQNCDIIRYNLLVNNIKNVQVYEAAASDVKGISTLSNRDASMLFNVEGNNTGLIENYHDYAQSASHLMDKIIQYPTVEIAWWYDEGKMRRPDKVEDLPSEIVTAEDFVSSDLHFAPITTIDDFIYLEPSIIKIDVEGMEWETVVGGKQTWQLFKPHFFIEIHNTIQVEPKRIWEYIDFESYDVFSYTKEDVPIYHWITDTDWDIPKDSYIIGRRKI